MLHAKTLTAYNKSRNLKQHKHIPKPLKFCYAPFSSLYFGQQGKVTACCINRSHLLGEYPQQSVEEIWTGKPAQTLRQLIAAQDLISSGCNTCAQQFKVGNYVSIKAKDFDTPYASQKKPNYPALLEFEIDNTCNLECVMCNGVFSSSIRKNREKLPPLISPYDTDFVTQLKAFIPHISQANFFGGEPFLVPIYYEIWDAIADLNPEASLWIITNGTILNKRVKSLLDSLQFNITMSIDSFEKTSYESIRINSSFEKVMDNFKYFYQYTQTNHRNFSINTCFMRPNWQNIPQMVKKCNSMGISINLIPVVYPEHLSLSSLPISELKKIVAYFEAQSFDIFDYKSQQNAKQFQNCLNLVKEWLNIQQNKKLVYAPNTMTSRDLLLHRLTVFTKATHAIEEVKILKENQKRFFKRKKKIEKRFVNDVVEKVLDFYEAIDPFVLKAALVVLSERIDTFFFTSKMALFIERATTYPIEEQIKMFSSKIIEQLPIIWHQATDADIKRLCQKTDAPHNQLSLFSEPEKQQLLKQVLSKILHISE